MILGFVGTGKIASSVITGICKSNLKFKKIIFTETSIKELEKKYA